MELAQSGPADWPRTSVHDIRPTVKHVGTTKVSAVTQTDSSLASTYRGWGHLCW